MGGNVSRHVAWKLFESRIVSSPKRSKLRCRKAFCRSRSRGSATASARCVRKGEVATLRCMPSVDGVSFSAADATMMTQRRSGQCRSSKSCSALESARSARHPFRHATRPPSKLRHADPEPSRAVALSEKEGVSRTP